MGDRKPADGFDAMIRKAAGVEPVTEPASREDEPQGEFDQGARRQSRPPQGPPTLGDLLVGEYRERRERAAEHTFFARAERKRREEDDK
jgi:hypothetical protein